MIQQEKNKAALVETTHTPIAFYEKRIDLDDLPTCTDPVHPALSFRYGIIDRFTPRSFINTEYGYTSTQVFDRSCSVIFTIEYAQIVPEANKLNASEFIYVVHFATDGIVKNTKTGKDHPAIYYKYPIEVLHAIPKKTCVQISVQKNSVYVKTITPIFQASSPGTVAPVIWKSASALPTDSIDKIKLALKQAASKNGYILSSTFPVLARQCGIENFRDYADTVEEFLLQYLPDYDLEKNVVVNGKKYPGLIKEKSRNIVTDAQQDLDGQLDLVETNTILESPDFSELDRLYEEKKYIEYLSSPILKQTLPCYLPIAYFEKAINCAAKLLHPESDEIVVLNSFQKELISAHSTIDIIKKWKGVNGYPVEILQLCGESSIAKYDSLKDARSIAEQINRVGYTNTLNNNYVGITNRFVACENELIPHMYIVRAFVQQGKSAAQRCITEYCQIAKNLKESISGRVGNYAVLASFPSVLSILQNYILQEIDLIPQNLKTNIFSTFLDTNNVDALSDILFLLSPDKASNEHRLVDLIRNSELWTEGQFSRLFSENISLQILQKCLALIWQNYELYATLPLHYLRQLSWVIKYNHYTSIDEIMRYHFSGNFTKLQKQRMLIESIPAICSEAELNCDMYALASYVVLYVYQNNPNIQLSDDVQQRINSWESYSDNYYSRALNFALTSEQEKKEVLLRFFDVFKLDTLHEIDIQNRYAKWYISRIDFSKLSKDDFDRMLDELYADNAYDAYLQLRTYSAKFDYETTNRIEEYAECLIALHRYAELISYLLQNDEISKALRDTLLIKAVCENFRENALSPKAFSIFRESFTVNDAIEILIENISTNRNYIITALLALYCYNNEFEKAIYLFNIYQEKAENGFTRLYSQFRSRMSRYQMNRYTEKKRNHYDVIQLSFYALSSDSLIEFFDWAKRIPIPDSIAYQPTHSLSFYYDALINDPHSEKVWTKLSGHLAKYEKLNAWYLVVCREILKEKFGYVSSIDIKKAFESVFAEFNLKNIPYNLLPVAFSYVMEKNDVDVVHKLLKFLQNENVKAAIMENNPWYGQYFSTINKFRNHCMVQYASTKDSSYYDLMITLGITLDVSDMKQISETDVDKQYLFATICKNYLTGQHVADMIDLLNTSKWSYLSDSDQEVLNLLRLLYDNDESLLDLQRDLFPDENSVFRFKRDCAQIIAEYPNKTGLYKFDSNCLSLSHKFVVYSYIFRILYDEDIYKKYKYQPSYLQFTDRQEYKSAIAFMSCAYLMQLTYNASYHFLYLRFRYLKLYISLVLQHGIDADDSFIISAMRKNNHYDDVHNLFYLPLKRVIIQFWGSSMLPQEAKECFLYGIMVGNSADFFAKYSDVLQNIPFKLQEQLQCIISLLDYRSVNQVFFNHFYNDIVAKKFDIVLTAAQSVSVFVYDVIVALREMCDDPDCFRLFNTLLRCSIPQDRIGMISKVNKSTFEKYAEMLIPLYCSSQFPFYIYRSWRQQALTVNKKGVPNRNEVILNYLCGHSKAEPYNVVHYLRALRACMQKDRALAAQILREHDIRTGIPDQWKTEALKICNYANGKDKKFIPEQMSSDTSRTKRADSGSVTFIKRLSEIIDVETVIEDDESAETMYGRFASYRVGTWEKLQTGISLLSYYEENRREASDSIEKSGSVISRFDQLVLAVGLEAIDPANDLAFDDQLFIAAELFSVRRKYKNEGFIQQLSKLNNRFAELLRKELTFSTWVRQADVIEEFLSETNSGSDFMTLRLEILKPYEECLSAGYAQEDRYEKLQKLLMHAGELENLPSIADNVLKSINAEKRSIERGSRLQIEITNSGEKITDGYVYFQIKNIGTRTISLNTEEFSIIIGATKRKETGIQLESIINLRSGFVTGGRALVVSGDRKGTVNVFLKIVQNLKNGTKVTICKAAKELKICSSGTEMTILDPDTKYIVDKAVESEESLRGRTNEQERLSRCVDKGVTVIYGPSRIGKTSLLNWVRNDFAKNQKNVMTVLYGGEDGRGKENHYRKHFADNTKEIPYEDDDKMSEYLLAETIVHSFGKRSRFIEPSGRTIPDGLYSEIVDILNEKKYLNERYYDLDKLLSKYGLELWLLLDEFQQVVKNWHPDSGCEFSIICGLLSSTTAERLRIKNIKVIVCGSDDLLKHMVLSYDSSWKQIFNNATRIGITPLLEDPFTDMIKLEPALMGTNIGYSDEALHALFQYTDGVALYGKEICNSILEDISKNPEKYKHRNTIYVSDVADATQRLLDKQTHDFDIERAEGIVDIYRNVVKELESTTMNYLWYMARWLYENPEKDGFREELFTERRLKEPHNLTDLHDAVEIAKARGIIRPKTSEKSDEYTYIFRTLFYYFAFAGSAPRMEFLEETIFEPEADETEVEVSRDASSRLVESFKLMPDKPTALYGLYRKMDPDDQKAYREDFAREVHIVDTGGGDIVTRGGTKQNIQINIQNMTNAFSTILSGATGPELIDAYRSLPKLQDYHTMCLPEVDQKRLLELPVLIQETTDEATINQYVCEMEAIQAPAQEEMCSNYSHAIINASRNLEEEFSIWETLGIKQKPYYNLTRKLDPSFVMDLYFAAKLDSVFSLIAKQSEDKIETDFSPVSIMYCKIIEKMLKFYHATVYQKRLPDASTEVIYRGRKISFGELRNPSIRKEVRNKIMLGAFLYPLNPRYVKNDTLMRLAEAESDDDNDMNIWKRHGEALQQVKDIRNKSAHGEAGIIVDDSMLRNLKEILFGCGGLERIVDLCE